ncbi:putative O-acetyltransferase CAS1 [Morella rubra]|uniref:Putative O-acetyltransferase CAS1 n=1 Tax=Morella rubra TaxID=262757 RepID=A0A6A1VM97_9ROSI|nr:putative O-acetyltransferase CAS1 [Morella rubra]
MVIGCPITPGQVASLLGIIPVVAAWIYSELFEIQEIFILCQSKYAGMFLSYIAWVEFLGTKRSEFGILMAYFYLCDRTDFFDSATKSYNRDLFWFLYFLLIRACRIPSLKIHQDQSPFAGKSMLYLNRHQTEEWKGWMQVLFLMYHYFAATEIYNYVRTMWRLNFLVLFSCIVLDNSYMVYYICPMHTLFTLIIYGALGFLSKYKELGWVIAVKIISCFLLVIIVWEVPGAFDLVWRPLTFLLGYTDPNPSRSHLPCMHEWHFHSGLDRYIWIIGMIDAYFHPTVERWLEKLEEIEVKRRISITIAVALASLMVGYAWFKCVYKVDKITYNKYHPYTSWIPGLHMFAECHPTFSYLQFDILCMAWKDYSRDLNLTNSYLVKISHRIFELSNVLKTAFVPCKDNQRIMFNMLTAVAVSIVLYSLSLLLCLIPWRSIQFVGDIADTLILHRFEHSNI